MINLWGEELGTDETRLCIHCKKRKPLEEMDVDRPHTAPQGKGYRNECKACRRQISKDITRLKKDYAHLKPTLDDHCQICEEQGHDLMIGRSQGTSKRKSPWVLDHCHVTNSFRGWICYDCNNGLSGFKDRKDITERAVKYLDKTQ